jgi:hypothetical protein
MTHAIMMANTITIMKATTPFEITGLVIAAGYPCTVVAEILGARLPASIDAVNILGAYVSALAVLTLFASYPNPRRSLTSAVPEPVACPVGKLRAREANQLAA